MPLLAHETEVRGRHAHPAWVVPASGVLALRINRIRPWYVVCRSTNILMRETSVERRHGAACQSTAFVSPWYVDGNTQWFSAV